jgi:hypothetical protein
MLLSLGALVVGAVVVLPVPSGAGVGGARKAYAAPVDPTPSRPTTPPGKPKPTATSTPTESPTDPPSPTESPTDPPTTSEPTGTSATSQPPSTTTATGTATSRSRGSSSHPSFQALPSQTAPPPAATAPTGRVTTPTAAGGGNAGGNGGGNGGNGGGNGGGGNNPGGTNGSGGSQPTQVAVAGRKVASPAGDGRSTLEVASGTTSASSPEATTGSPGTSALTSGAPDRSGSSTASTSSAPDLADPSGDDAVPTTWRVAALAALVVLGLAVALLVAAARPRGGAHRRH